MKDSSIPELVTGLIVEVENGDRGLVVLDRILFKNCYRNTANYNEYLTHPLSGYDIVKIYGRADNLLLNDNSVKRAGLLWDRNKVKEVTLEDIEKKFGCKVKIVGDK